MNNVTSYVMGGLGLAVVVSAWCLDLYGRGLPLSPGGLLQLHLTSVSPWVVDTLPIVLGLAQHQLSRPTPVAASAGHWDGDALADGALEALLLVDATGVIQAVNLAAERMFGMQDTDLTGRPLTDAIPDFARDPSDLGRTRRTMDRVVLGVEWDFEAVHRTGRRFPVKVSYVRTGEGLLLRLRTEIEAEVSSEAQESIRRLTRALEEARERLRARSDFIASMAHDLRTPLNAVIGYAEMLQDDVESEEMLEDLDRIAKAGLYLLQLVNDVLDMSKIDAGKLVVVREHVSLADVVADVVSTTRGRAEDGRNELVAQVDPTSNLVLADPVRLRQVLINLVGNASKFTQQGTIRLHAGPAVREGRYGVEISVSDTGPGIEPAQLENLFVPYRTSDLQRSHGGTGLGLVICKHLTEAMEGRLDVESTVGQGTTFRIFLPAPALSRVTRVPEFLALLPARTIVPDALSHELDEGDTERVDDLPRVAVWYTARPARLASRLASHLDARGWQVLQTADDTELADRLRQASVLLVDLVAPRSWDVLTELAGDHPVVVTGVDEDVTPALTVGAREVIVEPAGIETWIDALERARLRSRPVGVLSENADLLEALQERLGPQAVVASDVEALAIALPRPTALVASSFDEVTALRQRWPDLPLVVHVPGAERRELPGATVIVDPGDDGVAQVLLAITNVLASE